MTEAEWLACEKLRQMMLFLSGKVSNRKLRLLAVAGCRCVCHLMTDDNSQRVEVAERFADGLCSESDLFAAWEAPNRLNSRIIGAAPFPWDAEDYANAAAGDAAHSTPWDAAYWACELARDATNPEGTNEGIEERAQTRLLRDIFGNPFRPVTFAPEWRTDTVLALARTMYDAREFSAMLILADALQDAGCDSDDILGHCRAPGTHVRGCWVVDLVLGKS